jgi:hypothetical protein
MMMNELMVSFIKSLMEKKNSDASEAVMGGGAAPEATPMASAEMDAFTQAPAMQQSMAVPQQQSYAGNQNMAGIPDLLKQYGQGSQGLLQFFGNQ